MGKLIPLSMKQAKSMGVVSTKKGLFIDSAKIKQMNKTEKKQENQSEKESESRKRKTGSEKVKEVIIVQKGARAIERQRLEDRGIF